MSKLQILVNYSFRYVILKILFSLYGQKNFYGTMFIIPFKVKRGDKMKRDSKSLIFTLLVLGMWCKIIAGIETKVNNTAKYHSL